jgi:hypothetical protein
VEQIVVKGRLETESIGSGSRRAGCYVLIDETAGEALYALSDPRDLLKGRRCDLVQVHGTVTETEEGVPLLEVVRVD